jgi:hypothetical protein
MVFCTAERRRRTSACRRSLAGHPAVYAQRAMDWSYPRAVESRIQRLTREIAEIDEFFYHTEKGGDRGLYAGMLERKRDDMVRSAVLQLHTAIDDLITHWITCRVLGIRPEQRRERTNSKQARALRKVLIGAGSMGFEMKLNLAVALRLLNTKTQKQLTELNTLRNRCSHNWLLKATVRRGQRPKRKKPPLLLYRGRDLHSVAVLKDMLGEYGPLYARMFGSYLDG